MIFKSPSRILIAGSFFNNDGPSGVKQVFNAASNSAGAIIQRVVVYNPASEHIIGYADTGAPVSQWDLTKRAVFAFGGPNAGSNFMETEFELSPGLGFWVWMPSANAKVRIAYRLLA